MQYEITQHRLDSDMYEITYTKTHAGSHRTELVAVANTIHLPDELRSRLENGETVIVTMKEVEV